VSDTRSVVRRDGGSGVKITRRQSDCLDQPASLTRGRPAGRLLYLNATDCNYDDTRGKVNLPWTDDGIWQADEASTSFSRQSGGNSDMSSCYGDQSLNISDFDESPSYNCDVNSVSSNGVPVPCQRRNIGYSRRSLRYATDTSSTGCNRKVEQSPPVTDINANAPQLSGENAWNLEYPNRVYPRLCPVNCFDEWNNKNGEKTGPVVRRIALLPDPVDCPKMQCDSETDSNMLSELLNHVESLITLYHDRQTKTQRMRNASTCDGNREDAFCEPLAAPPPNQPRLRPCSTVNHNALWTNDSSGSVSEPPKVQRGSLLGSGRLLMAPGHCFNG
jgi:hypothetical protein